MSDSKLRVGDLYVFKLNPNMKSLYKITAIGENYVLIKMTGLPKPKEFAIGKDAFIKSYVPLQTHPVKGSVWKDDCGWDRGVCEVVVLNVGNDTVHIRYVSSAWKGTEDCVYKASLIKNYKPTGEMKEI